MKFKCCDYLMYHLVFAQADVMACCCSPNNLFIKFYKQESGKNFDLERYKEVREYYINLFKQGIIPNICKNCGFIKEQDWDESICFKTIIVANRTKCSCNCIYCSLMEGETSIEKKKDLNTRVPYEIKPILEEIKESRLLSENCNIQIAGGEPVEYPDKEFDWLLNFAVSMNCNLEVLSSGILFSKELEKALKKHKIRLIISPDTAIKSTYEKIKRVKAFDSVWKNLKRYVAAASKNPLAVVSIKYIIIPGINDNTNEINMFIKKIKSIKCRSIIFSFEYSWLNSNKNSVLDDNMLNVINCIKSIYYNDKNDFSVEFDGQSENLFKEYFLKEK